MTPEEEKDFAELRRKFHWCLYNLSEKKYKKFIELETKGK